ncbi:hypothetical protein DFJ58DRAFT_724611 [Suillus subalutaceus]|uniref:uncharacterized protein n=1 Tax=Suillus subalutaceus TaxID=48586 RepID=UPI001B86F20F|nr:uncharacterized protein DFJ58DRAFT_724611 [Suillus subalutaceus]KAG1864632.1 hypothetical protein DFJ58DRAFT_724611 [Suillus subalutaceus]
MRIKQLWNIIPLPSKIKLLWDRITLSRTTAFYFVFSILHCVLQIIFQGQAFRINVGAAEFLASITTQGDTIDSDAFYVLGSDLRLCDSIPADFSTSSCQIVWNGTTVGDNSVASANAVASTSHSTGTPSSMVSTLFASSGSKVSTISMSSSYSAMSSSTISTSFTSSESKVLTSSMSSSYSTMSTFTTSASPTTTATSSSTTFTDLVSSSHTATSSAMASSATDKERRETAAEMPNRRNLIGDIQAVEVNGTVQVIAERTWLEQSSSCFRSTVPLGSELPSSNTEREDLTFIAFQIWVLGMSIVAVLNESVPHTIATLLTHMLATVWAGYQIFNTAQFHGDFSRLSTNGACNPINLLPSYWKSRFGAEIASLVLNVVALLVSSFLSWRLAKLFGWQTFKRVGASITISRVYKLVLVLSIVIQMSLFFMVVAISLWLDQLCNGNIGRLNSDPVYKPFLIVTLILLLPWLTTGWYGVRRELKIPMLVFLALSVGYLAGWAAMFDSTAFRWTYMTWTFFGVMTTASVSLALVAFILGIICRVNFGKGLIRYLNTEEPIPEDFVPVNYEDDIEKIAFPTDGMRVPTFSTTFGAGQEVSPSQMLAPPMWEKFSTPEGSFPAPGAIQVPQVVLARLPSSGSYNTAERHVSNISTHSSTSTTSGHSKRWVIE